MAEPTEWEYRVQSFGHAFRGPKDEELEEVLNAWGEESWEVVSALPRESSPKVTVVAKRPLPSATRRRRSLVERNW